MGLFKVEFCLDVDESDAEEVEEAIKDLVNQEIELHKSGERRCSVRLLDSFSFQVSPCEERD